MPELREASHWIGGQWRADGEKRNSIDPATGETVGICHDGDAGVAAAAIDAAAAFETGHWRNDGFLRATALSHPANAYEARLQDEVGTLCRENDKLRGEATFEASLIPRALRFAAGLAMHDFGRVMETRPAQRSMPIRSTRDRCFCSPSRAACPCSWARRAAPPTSSSA